jgi:23S rRNA (adenine2503-C2)-methyltransferase
MPEITPHPSPPAEFFGLPPDRVREGVTSIGWPKFRADQLLDWVYRKLVTDPSRMTNLPARDRQAVAERLVFTTSTLARQQDSADGTIKLLLTFPGGGSAETVMIPDGDRRTACVSSQVGCPVQCRFCASGLEGLKGNLSAGQIVEQVFRLNEILDRQTPPNSRPLRVTNIVFMGMGEPLSNYESVMRAVRILHDPACFNLGARRITISTVGVPPKIRRLAEEDLPLNLALSLHAPNEPLRRELIPWASHFALDDILDACRYYFDRTGREITLEYILLADVNDRPEHARQLARLCRTMRANVNLIRYNEVEALPFKRPVSGDVMVFQKVLRDAGVNAHVRKSRGRDIDAACGQLRRKEAREQVVGLSVAGRADD